MKIFCAWIVLCFSYLFMEMLLDVISVQQSLHLESALKRTGGHFSKNSLVISEQLFSRGLWCLFKHLAVVPALHAQHRYWLIPNWVMLTLLSFAPIPQLSGLLLCHPMPLTAMTGWKVGCTVKRPVHCTADIDTNNYTHTWLKTTTATTTGHLHLKATN